MSSLRKTTAALIRRTTYSATRVVPPPTAAEGGVAAALPHDGVGVATEIEKSIASGALQRRQQQQQLKRQPDAAAKVSTATATTAATTTTTTTPTTATTSTVAAAASAVRPYSEVPGPYPLPLIGNSWRFAPLIGTYKISDLDKVMHELHVNYGKMAKVGGLIGHPDLLFVFDGDEIRNIFKKEETMPHRPSMPSLRHYKGELRRDFFGDVAGLIGVHGPKWEAFRQEVQHILLQPQTAKKYIPPLNDIASEFMVRIDEMRNEKQELPDNFLHELYKWALESVGRVSLDTRLGCLKPEGSAEAQQIIEAINTFFWAVPELELRMPLWRVYPTKAYRSFIRALDQFSAICMKNISKTMDKADADQAQDVHKNEADISIVERIVRKTGNRKLAAILALDLFLVGVDTTSVAASSTIYQLAKNPEKQQRLFEELKQAFPTSDAQINQHVLEQMPYMRACVKETLRMRPVVIANGRSLQSDAVINGYHVPKGTHVIFPHLVVSNDPTYFPEPKSFIPERWLKQSAVEGCPHAGQKIHPFVSLPFGYGRRMCVGRRFAEIELHTLLAKIFRKYKVSYDSDEFVYRVNSTYIPKSPLNFKLTPREE
ncbi:probable cytochrome P450 49a1 [Drosophila sulfurigaster albostrigata]|uniref:probable cytochrome P450 49a1 n=1 Tax=Drosophila sulfurigaster albostrigata TaxID=89887 RepID=UPI002D21DE4D|nr:probable cytochrome P450 49a1 [Drosophila sulfurigaster albostrigata]